jgi:mono/diheme cytochrome c family protein
MRRRAGACDATERRRRWRVLPIVLCVVAGWRPATAGAATPAGTADPARGKVLFALAGGCGCHTPPGGPVGAGGGEVPTPFGTFFGTNITPDPETIRDGIARDKGVETPAMPYYQYAGMADADVADLIAYLRTLPTVRRPNRAHEGELPLARVAYRLWRLVFTGGPRPPSRAPTAGIERGRYLVDHVAICTDCHTPRNVLGAPRRARYLAGTRMGADAAVVPNITPHATGIAAWDVEDVVNVLTLGMLPNYDNVQGPMADVVEGQGGGPGYRDAPDRDRRAIAEYLRTVPPIDNPVRGK